MLLFNLWSRHIVAVFFAFLVTACANTPNSNPYRSPSKSQSINKEMTAQKFLKVGVRYLELDMLKPAKDRLEVAYALNDNNDQIHNALGVLFERLKQDDKAELHYKDAIRLNPNDARICNNYGRFLCERGRYEQGILLLNQAIAMPLNDRKWYALTNLGRCELLQGKKQVAEGILRQALQENSRFAPALIEMQKISYRKGKFLSARAFLERYLAVAKHNQETLWFAVQTERALGNKKLTDEYKQLLFRQYPASKETQQLKKMINIK